jgi:hypothetical protein
MGGGNAHQRAMQRGKDQKLAERVADSVVEKISGRPITPEQKTIRHKLFDFVEHGWFIGAVTTVGALVGFFFYSPVLVLCIVGILLAFIRSGVVDGYRARTQAAAYIFVLAITTVGMYAAYRAIKNHLSPVPTATEPTSEPVPQNKPTPPAPKATTPDAPKVSKEQLEEIKQLDAIFAGLDENDLRTFFGFDEMVELNMRMYQARIKHFKETGEKSFSLIPYIQGQEMLMDTSVAGEHVHGLQGGGWYDFDPNQIAFIVLPRKYSENKKILLRYENSTSLPTSVVIRVKDFDDTLGENATQLIRVMDASLKENADYILDYNIPDETQYWHAVPSRYWRDFKNLRPKADKIRDGCRMFLNVP